MTMKEVFATVPPSENVATGNETTARTSRWHPRARSYSERVRVNLSVVIIPSGRTIAKQPLGARRSRFRYKNNSDGSAASMEPVKPMSLRTSNGSSRATADDQLYFDVPKGGFVASSRNRPLKAETLSAIRESRTRLNLVA